MNIARNLADLFQTNGKVGIGTDSADGQLHVKGTTNKTLKLDPTFSAGSMTTLAFARNGNDKWRVVHPSDDSYLSFYNEQDSAHQLTLKSDGNVGIGTTTPVGKLEVNAGTGNTFRAIRYEDHLMEIGNYNASDGYRATLYGSNEHRFMTATAGAGSGSIDMTITDGNVGIGISAPAAKLHVVTPYSEGIRFTDGVTTPYSKIKSGSGYAGIGTDTVNEIINWRTDTDNGYVGIGAINPSYKLDIYNNTTDTGSQLRVKNAHTAVGADAVINIDGYGASTLKLWRNGIEEWKLERIVSSDNLGLYAYGGAVGGGAGAGLIQFWDYDSGNIGIGTSDPGARLEIYDSHGGNTNDHSSYGHPVSGGSNGALYINKGNSRIDWQDGLVFCGEGTTWSARFTGRAGLTTNSDTNGEILGVHPVEGSATASWNDTAGANSVASAYFRVMGNGKTFADKLYAEDAFIAPSHASDNAASSAGGNVAGAIYYNTGSAVHRSYNGTNWSNIGAAPITESTFDAFGDGSAICLLKANNSNLDTGGNHNASLSSGVTYNTTSKFGSHSFNPMGNGTYVDIPSLPMVETVSFWFYCVGSNRGYLVDFRHDAPNNGRSYLYTHDGAPSGTGQNINMGNDTTTTNRTGTIYINGAQYTSGAYNFYDGTWYHIVIVRNATDTHRTWDQGLRFGNRSDASTEGNAGYFDQIRVFDRQINASEALALYNEVG